MRIQPEEKILENWVTFAKLAEQAMIGKPYSSRYIFRGQANADWDLSPRLLRYARAHGLGTPHTFDMERGLMRAFQRMAHLHVPQGTLPVSTAALWSQWWVLMQHFGAPTRILDWTLSPYVALYFAVEREFLKDGAVWLVKIGPIADSMNSRFNQFEFPDEYKIEEPCGFWNKDTDQIYIPEPTFQMDRMAAQQYVFTISPKVNADHGEIISAAQPQDNHGNTYFGKIVIPAKLKRDLLSHLKSMNVTAASLFPGLDGLGRSITELAELSSDFWAGQVWSAEG